MGGAKRACGRVCIVAALAVALGAPQACGGDPLAPESDALRILFVGNSLTYTNDLPGMLASLLELGGVEGAVVESEALPNFGLQDHWVLERTRDRIREGRWSVVVLQQGPSATEGRPSLLEYAERFAGEIRSAGAVPGLYMVWPSRGRFFDFDGVLDSYRTAAERVDGLFFPAGEAWRIAWESNADYPFYGFDGFHPTYLGTYMAALVMYEQLSGRDPGELPAFVPAPEGDIRLDADVAAALQRAARDANARHARVPDPGRS